MCTLRQPLERCISCSMVNRGAARFCRACRTPLRDKAEVNRVPAAALQVSTQAVLGGVPGVFRRPPRFADGFLYALSVDGTVLQLSCKDGAEAKPLGSLRGRGAGMNGSALTRVLSGEKGLRGRVLIAQGVDAVEAMVLATGERVTLFEPGQGMTLVANGSEAESTAFKGVVATGEWCGFVLRNDEGDFVLALRSFAEDKRVDHALTLAGQALLGPVLNQGCIALCTDEAAGVYDTRTRESFQMRLPRQFKPLFSRSTLDLNVPPGSAPLGVSGSGTERKVWIGGMEAGRSGVLQLDLESRESYFRPLAPYCSLTTQSAGGLVLATLEGIEGLGLPDPGSQPASLAAEMPVYWQGGTLGWFAEQGAAGRHRLVISPVGARTRLLSMEFEDLRCDASSCCGMMVTGQEVMALYLDPAAGRQGAGLKFARWALNAGQAFTQ